MRLQLFQIDAFTDRVFAGNPACVVPLTEWLPSNVLLEIARENAVAETAFFVPQGNRFHLRWFTPDIEMDLCGHATLATAHAIKTILGHPSDIILFDTLSGELAVSVENGRYVLDFPSREPKPASLPDAVAGALSFRPNEVWKARDYLLLFNDEQKIREMRINRPLFDSVNLGTGGVIITAKGTDCDFVSRFFTPQATILEDAVTGSAHCTLVPFWSRKLNKTRLTAKQLSERGGTLFCEDKGDRTLIGGNAKTYFTGKLQF